MRKGPELGHFPAVRVCPGVTASPLVPAALSKQAVNSTPCLQRCVCPSGNLGPPAGPVCPDGWVGYRGKCYYFSEGKGDWTYSRAHCSALNASLAGIDTRQDMVRDAGCHGWCLGSVAAATVGPGLCSGGQGAALTPLLLGGQSQCTTGIALSSGTWAPLRLGWEVGGCLCSVPGLDYCRGFRGLRPWP
uniref:C-type lectin domain-containing protein n=1 Tax=Pelusios castaneus TaxID=367368 RepID=A0A8C8SHY3_9SAUR